MKSSVLALCGAWLLASTSTQAAQPGRGCVIVQAIARYVGPGYNHIAATENRCARAVVCELWTDVDPEPQHVIELTPQASQDTVFRINSPAYGFVVHYRCRYR